MPNTRTALRLLTALVALVLLVPAAAVVQAQPLSGGFPSFIPLPASAEGVAVDRTGTVYVTVREDSGGTIWRFDRDGLGAPLVRLGDGMIGGLAVDPNGTLYAAMAIGPDRGVYRVTRDGIAERIPGTEEIFFANALAFDPRGDLYVSESFSVTPSGYGQGGIWRVSGGNGVELWLRDALLTGPAAPPTNMPVGANGIAYYHGDLYVVNTNSATIVRVGVRPDGQPGQPEVWFELPPMTVPGLQNFPAMGDGLALDVHGNVYLAVVSRNAILRINADDKSWTVLTSLDMPGGALLDTPTSLAFGTGGGEQQNLFVANLGWLSSIFPGPQWPGPAIVKVAAGIPGLPLE
jgi:sugar lactone lactonase YvrE